MWISDRCHCPVQEYEILPLVCCMRCLSFALWAVLDYEYSRLMAVKRSNVQTKRIPIAGKTVIEICKNSYVPWGVQWVWSKLLRTLRATVCMILFRSSRRRVGRCVSLPAGTWFHLVAAHIRIFKPTKRLRNLGFWSCI